MTTEEIFAAISAHFVKGMMIHDQMADYYDFLSLRGYKRCHEYHFKKESANYRKLHRYHLNHYHRLIPEQRIDNPEIIPATWYKYTRADVDPSTKRNAVKTGIEKWISWEKETKEKLQQALRDLAENGDEAAVIFIGGFLQDVDCELKHAERKALDLAAAEYNLPYILTEQTKIHDKYKKRL